MSAPFDQALAHSAMTHLKSVDRRRLPAVARQEMQKEFPCVAEELIDEHLDFAGRLLERACSHADGVRDKILTENEALARLKAEFPGMIDRDYAAAMGHGYLATR